MESIPGIIGWKQRHFSCHCPHSHPNTQLTTQDLHAIANLRCDFAHPVVHLASAQRYLIVWPGRYWRCNIHPHCFDLVLKNIYLEAGHIRVGGISYIREYHNQKGGLGVIAILMQHWKRSWLHKLKTSLVATTSQRWWKSNSISIGSIFAQFLSLPPMQGPAAPNAKCFQMKIDFDRWVAVTFFLPTFSSSPSFPPPGVPQCL